MLISKQICVLPLNFSDFLLEMVSEFSCIYGPAATDDYRKNIEYQLNTSIAHSSVNAFAVYDNRLAIGIGIAQMSGDTGKITLIHLLGKHNTERASTLIFESLVGNLRERGARQILMDFVPLCSLSLAEHFEAEGFRTIERMIMSCDLLGYRNTPNLSGIRKCTPADWGNAPRVLVDAFIRMNEPVLYHDLQTIDSAQNVLRQYRAGGYGKIQQECAIAAVCENEVLGIALGTSVSSDVGFVFQVAVIPEYQNKGIGRKLVTSLLAEFVDLGMHEALLGTTVSDPAYTLYKRLGFRDKRAVQVQVWSC